MHDTATQRGAGTHTHYDQGTSKCFNQSFITFAGPTLLISRQSGLVGVDIVAHNALAITHVLHVKGGSREGGGGIERGREGNGIICTRL